jgi:hypothetical protein
METSIWEAPKIREATAQHGRLGRCQDTRKAVITFKLRKIRANLHKRKTLLTAGAC